MVKEESKATVKSTVPIFPPIAIKTPAIKAAKNEDEIKTIRIRKYL